MKERKQAESLLYERFPLDLVERIGVRSAAVQARVGAAITRAHRRAEIEIQPDWYF